MRYNAYVGTYHDLVNKYCDSMNNRVLQYKMLKLAF
jgi:hypothetical protein